jgi:hypothetical protein
MREATRSLLEQVPYISRYHPLSNASTQSHVRGCLRHPFIGDWWRCTEVMDDR